MTASDSDDAPKVAITITEMRRSDMLQVVAFCPTCHVFRERFIPNAPDARGLAYIIATDALAEAGCAHIEAVTITRKTLSIPPRKP
jgi:hypothetical protein